MMIMKAIINIIDVYSDFFHIIANSLVGVSQKLKVNKVKSMVCSMKPVDEVIPAEKCFDLPYEVMNEYFQYSAVYGSIAFLDKNAINNEVIAYSNNLKALSEYCENIKGYERLEFYGYNGYFLMDIKNNVYINMKKVFSSEDNVWEHVN